MIMKKFLAKAVGCVLAAVSVFSLASCKYPRLALSYARLLNKQKLMLIQMGLQEQFNVQMVKFLLSNNHGMSEKTSAQVDAKTDNKFEVNIKVID